jgi:hypothetical protein
MPYVNVYVELCDIDTDDLIEELESRDEYQTPADLVDLIRKVYEKRRLGQDYQRELDELIYETTGRIV